MWRVPSTSPTANTFVRLSWNFNEESPMEVTVYWIVHLCDWSIKSHMSRVPSSLPMKRTPALVWLQQPQVWKAFLLIMLWKIGTSTSVRHTEKWKSKTVSTMSSLDGQSSRATVGLYDRYWFQYRIKGSFLVTPSSPARTDQSQTNSSPWSELPVKIVCFWFFLNAIWEPPSCPPPSGLNSWKP
jgi:hypothetical protein